MRIGIVFYWCVFAFHLCKGEDVVKTESRDSGTGGRRQQWGPASRSGSFMSDSALAVSNEQILNEACNNEPACLKDRAGLEAITQLHRQLDDDANGNVDLNESDDVSIAPPLLDQPQYKEVAWLQGFEEITQLHKQVNDVADGNVAHSKSKDVSIGAPPLVKPWQIEVAWLQGFEAITQLHKQLDDDADGNVDLTESNDFLREELQYDSGYEKRQRAFHHNDDMHISVKELWEAWLRSEVHNWTVEQTVEWLSESVDLPQYKTLFLQHKITGATLPRLAVNNMQYLSNVLGIKDPIHKQKLALKAMDVVLFGPPKEGSRWKDWLLATLLLVAVVGGWLALRAGRESRTKVYQLVQDLEMLRKSEQDLNDLQRELEKLREEQESVQTEKLNLEKKLREAGDTPLLISASSDLEVTQLKAEVEMLRGELRRAEGELEDRCWAPPPGLQQWLQLTHEVENRTYLRKKQQADLQLQQARDACEKLRKKRSSLVGAFVSTHGKSIDDVDRSIVEARTALNEVTQELQERMHRWKQIERLCGFNIINNNGMQYLESTLYRNGNTRTTGRGRMSSSQDDLSVGDETSLCGSVIDNFLWREDSSGSEADAPHYPLDLRLAEARLQLEERLAQEERERRQAERSSEVRRVDDKKSSYEELRSRSSYNDVRRSPVDERKRELVQFVLGGDNVNWSGEDSLYRAVQSASQPALRASVRGSPAAPPRRSPLSPLPRSRSTDVVALGNSGDEPRPPPRYPFAKQKTLSEDAQTPSSNTPPEEESTDSSLMDDEGVPKPRRRRIQLPFGKKAKTPA